VNAELRKDEIVGKTIKAIFIGPEQSDGETSGRGAFVQLSDGTLFELSTPDTQPIHRLEESSKLTLEMQAEELDCIGEQITEVVTADWFGFGLLLSSDRILLIGPIPPCHFGPILERLGETCFASELRDFFKG
jgi:hypothetical protein